MIRRHFYSRAALALALASGAAGLTDSIAPPVAYCQPEAGCPSLTPHFAWKKNQVVRVRLNMQAATGMTPAEATLFVTAALDYWNTRNQENGSGVSFQVVASGPADYTITVSTGPVYEPSLGIVAAVTHRPPLGSTATNHTVIDLNGSGVRRLARAARWSCAVPVLYLYPCFLSGSAV